MIRGCVTRAFGTPQSLNRTGSCRVPSKEPSQAAVRDAVRQPARPVGGGGLPGGLRGGSRAEAVPAVPGVVWGGFVLGALALKRTGAVDGSVEALFVVQRDRRLAFGEDAVVEGLALTQQGDVTVEGLAHGDGACRTSARTSGAMALLAFRPRSPDINPTAPNSR